jgi:hypothetical protein
MKKAGWVGPVVRTFPHPLFRQSARRMGHPQCIYANEINGVATCVEATSQKREVAHPQLFLITLKTTGVTLARETLATRQLAPITKSSNEFLYCFKSK